MRKVFTKMLEREVSQGGYPAKKARASKKWLQQKAREAKSRTLTNSKVRNQNPNILARQLQTPRSLKNRIMVGNMYIFIYDPKLKNELEHYDTFPLVIPIKDYSDGFLGINLHYLDPMDRAILMDALYDNVSDNNYDENTKLLLKYETMSKASKYKYFRPCLKRYLTIHARTRFIKIESAEWDNVLFLPTERFVKSNRRQVWSESTRKVVTNAI
tara:strand:- start:2609 stop:3250 length:642 start_codon:yes stop_codon:yes gene_type:complete